MEERRKFLRGVGLFGALAAGMASSRANSTPVVINNYTTVSEDEVPSKELQEQLEKSSVFQLNAVYGKLKPPISNSVYVINYDNYVEGTRKDVSVKIIPGPDGKLYVKENDTWRKL